MILNEKNKKPIISFGLGLTLFSCSVGDDVTIYTNDLYNNNEYYIDQNEQPEIVTLTYATFADPEANLIAEFPKEGIYNNRPYYKNTTSFVPQIYIFWDNQKWMIVSFLNITNGTFTQEVGRNLSNTPYPIFDFWSIGGTSIIPKNTTINTNNQRIIFPAVESKEIQINIVNKNTGLPMTSNKLNLIVE